MSDLLTTIAVAVVTNGAVLALFVWVFKVAFEKTLDKRVKLYERELELQHKKSFHQFSKIYDEQAAALRDIYAVLCSLYSQAAHLGFHYNFYNEHPELLEKYRVPKTGDAAAWDRYYKATLSEKPEEVRASALAEAASSALSEFRPKRIYLSAATADETERLLNLLLYVGSSFSNINYRDPHTLRPVVAKEVVDTWVRVLAACQTLFPQLEDQFRTLLAPPT